MSTSLQRPGIVVGIDGSAAAKVAVRWAARDAAMRHVRLTLVHVADRVIAPWLQTPVPTGFGAWQQGRGRQFIDEAIRLVDVATSGIGEVPINSEMYYSATVPTLVDMSKEAELIVVGCRGQGAFASLLGSVSISLVHHAHCPVAVIHDEGPS